MMKAVPADHAEDRPSRSISAALGQRRLMHEGLAAFFAYRLAQLSPITFTLAANDYGFELLSPEQARLEETLEAGLVSPDHLVHDIPASLNAAELAKRQFREIARVAGLIFQGYPGNNKSVKQVPASSGLLIARCWRSSWSKVGWDERWRGSRAVASPSVTWSGPHGWRLGCWWTGRGNR